MGILLLGSAQSVAVTGQSVVNAGASIQGFINLAKGFTQSTASPSNIGSTITADGFPISNAAMSADWTFSVSLIDPDYYGRYYMWWTGTGNVNAQNMPTIYYSGNAAVSNSSTIYAFNGLYCGNASGADQPTLATPLEFAFGTFFNAAANNGGLVQLTSPVSSPLQSTPSPAKFTFNNMTYNGGSFPAGPNSDGSWSVTVDDSSHVTLQGSGSLNPALIGFTNTGVAGTQSEGLISVSGTGQPSISIRSTQTISGWSGIFWVKKAHFAAAVAGQLASPDMVTAMTALNPRFIRFMDYQAVQGDKSSSYDYRSTAASFAWGVQHLPPDYWVGNITNGGSDAYTCANPTASPASGAPIDGEIVIGLISGDNTTFNPTLSITGRTGTYPILSSSNNTDALRISLFLTGTAPTLGSTQSFSFTGGGLVGTYNTTYTVLAGDTTLQLLGFSLKNKFRADATLLAAGIGVADNGTPPYGNIGFEYNPNIGGLGNSVLAISGSDGSAHTTYNFGAMATTAITAGYIGNLPTNNYVYLCFSKLLGAWFACGPNQTAAGINMGPPLEFYADLCNRAGTGCYIQVGMMWSADRITRTVQYFANNLNGELAISFSNETWNRFLAEWAPATGLGNCLGLSDLGGGNRSVDSFTALRIAQISQLAAAAWTGAGRSRSELFVQLEFHFVDVHPTLFSRLAVPNLFEGAQLNPATNTTLANFGGIGATAIANDPSTGSPYNFSASPRRPIDYSDLCGGAPYYTGAQWNCIFTGDLRATDYANAPITISAYNSMLLAIYNYTYGNPTQQAAALDFLFNGTSGDLYDGSLNSTTANDASLALYRVGSGNALSASTYGIGQIIASYDSSRASAGLSQLGYMCYEGDFNATIPSAASWTSLGYINGYASSLPGAASGPTGGSDTAALMETNALPFLLAFKNDDRFKQLTAKYLQICKESGQWNGSAAISRPSMGTHYGFENPNNPGTNGIWSFYSGQILSTPYKSWNAYQVFNN